tara:strand:+ start:363 stop:1133 length:771 start_codon:yes stop_codon:yes gene_type:complete
MLQSRIIPNLLIKDNALVKTINFKNPKYIGDPINAVKIFNEKSVDELIVTDIDATIKKQEPNYDLLEKIANECRMPLCYGGGILNIEQAQRIFSLGVEKIALSSAAIKNPYLISEIADSVGSQSVVLVLDVKRNFFGNKYEIFTHNGKNKTGIEPISFIKKLDKSSIGEIVINSIDNDGLMKGYDLKIIEKARNATDLPMTFLGGAGSLSDISKIITKYKIIGAGAGSLFVFKGKYRAVLINYPNVEEKLKILNSF